MQDDEYAHAKFEPVTGMVGHALTTGEVRRTAKGLPRARGGRFEGAATASHSSWTHSQVGPGLICSHQPVANLE